MASAKPVTTPPTNSITVRENTAPISARAVAASLFAAFVAGGLLAGALSWWALLLVGLVVGAVALYGMDRYGRSRG